MEQNYLIMGGAAVVGVLVLLWFLRRREAGPFSNLKTNKSGGDTINAVNSNVNTGAGDQNN
tara:strand:+ start:2531 stop:2713 length:183 start_codon:yes stop_codon:yes gene_type:complete